MIRQLVICFVNFVLEKGLMSIINFNHKYFRPLNNVQTVIFVYCNPFDRQSVHRLFKYTLSRRHLFVIFFALTYDKLWNNVSTILYDYDVLSCERPIEIHLISKWRTVKKELSALPSLIQKPLSDMVEFLRCMACFTFLNRVDGQLKGWCGFLYFSLQFFYPPLHITFD